MRDHVFLEVNWDVTTNCISREFGGLVVPARGSGQQTVLWGAWTNAVSRRGQYKAALPLSIGSWCANVAFKWTRAVGVTWLLRCRACWCGAVHQCQFLSPTALKAGRWVFCLFFAVLGGGHCFLHYLSSENEEGSQKKNRNLDTDCRVTRKTLMTLKIFSCIFFFVLSRCILRKFAEDWSEHFFLTSLSSRNGKHFWRNLRFLWITPINWNSRRVKTEWNVSIGPTALWPVWTPHGGLLGKRGPHNASRWKVAS